VTEWLLTLGLSACMCFGIFLRYLPFASVYAPGRRRLFALLNGLLVLCNGILLRESLAIWGPQAAMDYMRYGGVLFAGISCLIGVLTLGGWVREQIFTAGVVLNCNYLLMAIPNYILSVVRAEDSVMNLMLVVGIFGLSLALTFFPLYRLLRSAVEPYLKLEISAYWRVIWMIPLVFFAIKALSLGGSHDAGSPRQLLSSALQAGMMLLICVNVRSEQESYYRHQTAEKQLTVQKVHYAKLSERSEDIRKMNHDLKHHALAIRHYAKNRDIQEVIGYCDMLLRKTGEEEHYPYTGNAAADSIFSHYMHLAQQEGIQFDMKGTICSGNISDSDLCVLLGNALDNAVAACRELGEDRSIQVISQSEEKLLSVMVRNTFDGKVVQSENVLLSKKGKNRVGVGMSSMRTICQEYGGSLEICWDDRYFTLMFMIPLSGSDPGEPEN